MYIVLYSHNKTDGMCEGALKQTSDPARPGFEIPGSATEECFWLRLDNMNLHWSHWKPKPECVTVRWFSACICCENSLPSQSVHLNHCTCGNSVLSH